MKPAPQKYRTTNWKAYNAALKARGSLLIWLDPTMNWQGRATGKRGRSPCFSDEAIQFCLSIKCLFNLPLRQAMGMTQSLLQLAGLDWLAPDYSTVSRRQKTLRVTIEVVPTTTGLHLLVDSTGHVLRCDACEQVEIAYNSCRNRHCPKCQASAAQRWLEARQADLLPVPYYHVVFTLPAPISAIAYTNKAVIYGLLFDLAAKTLRAQMPPIAGIWARRSARPWSCTPGARH